MWDTDVMRVYLPALVSDLLADCPRRVAGFIAVSPPGAGRDDVEMLEDDAQTEAALACLELLRDVGADASEPAARLVLAADADVMIPPGSGVLVVPPVALTWKDVVAFLIDEGDAAGDVRSVLQAHDQDAADHAVENLWQHALEWFDISERIALASSWFPSGTEV